MDNIVCLMCAGLLVQAEAKKSLGQEVEIPEVNDAWTWAPSWQQQMVGNQMVMACVSVPVCKQHLNVAELTPAEQAVRSGRLLQGSMG